MKRKSSRAKVTRKPSVKKPSKKNIFAIASEIEKEFFSLPAKLVALCRREKLSIKQNQAQLNASLKNAETKHQNSLKKITALKKSKKKATRQQIMTAQKAVTAAAKLINEIKREINLTGKAIDAATKKQAGFALLAKELPSLRRKMAGAGSKTQKNPLRRKKQQRSVKPQTGAADRSQTDYQPSHPSFSTRSDTNDLS